MDNSLLSAAIELAKLGMKVYPLRPMTKQPIEKGGFHNATNELDKVVKLWGKYSNANIGIATGNSGEYASGIVVIDLDIDKEKNINGKNALIEWEQAQGVKINRDTWVAKTGRGGYHLYYKTNKDIKSSTSKVLSGVDIIANLKGIIAPPSIHPNGNRYKWFKSHSPKDLDIAELGEVEERLINNYQKGTYSKSFIGGGYTNFNVENDGIILDGCRNEIIFRKKVCKLQGKGLSDFAIRLEIQKYNQIHCSPPLENDELERILNSALSRYAKGGGRCWRA